MTNFSRYRVVNPEISYPTDPAIVARLLAGEAIPMADRGMVSRRAGDVVDDIPAESIAGLLAAGDIVAVDVAVAAETESREAAWTDLGRPDETRE